MTEELNLNWSCPLPLRHYPTVVMGHGSGGKMMADLIQHLFLPLFADQSLEGLGDAAVLELPAGRLAFSTDSFVVSPLFFPGGNIGELAVHGTVNDLAMMGAEPLFLSVGFILEEGLAIETLAQVAASLAERARQVGVRVVTGDTKVVEKGHGDGLYINTSGIGRIPAGVNIAPHLAQPGDLIILSGTLGDHGMAILSVRQGLAFETEIVSDSGDLSSLVSAMLGVTTDIHCLRDATRGGLAAALNELATASGCGMRIDETRLPVKPAVHAACEMLGLDPLYVANEGKLVAIVPGEQGASLLSAMRKHPMGAEAAIIGEVVAEHPGMLVMRTAIGASRVIDLPAGELLPRIC